MEDRIAKEKLNIILLVDASKSMGGTRIGQVDQAVNDIKGYLTNLQAENSSMDFYLTIIPFSNGANFYGDERSIPVEKLDYKGIKTGGWSNLHAGYSKLGEILLRQSKGGIMPDFAGTAPIILLLTDGHPTGDAYADELAKLQKLAWFKVALRYGIAIELDDARTDKVLKAFVGDNGDVIKCYNASLLKNIIKIIVLTASKVKSTSANVQASGSSAPEEKGIQQVISEALADADEMEW